MKIQSNTFSRIRRWPAAALLTLVFTGCAATISDDGLAQRTSAAIGRPIGSFTIADQNPETGGRINYSVNTKDGSQYQCYLYSATGFQAAMTFGQTPNSDAICTQMKKGASTEPVKAPTPNCNTLLKAAKRC